MELVKAGAADYIGKPWDDRKLLTCVRNLLELSQARRALADAARVTRERRQRLAREHDLRGVIYADPASERMLALACQVARSALSVLITGPNGSGKEKIAEILHANSRRRGAFVAVNCGALPAELIEAELFGAEAGAYTGANRPREGKFEAADGGTLFLDEIGTLPAAGQARLLRMLESGRFTRLGSNRECVVDVRVLSTTNADLPAMIGSGGFREDLYYRLNAVERGCRRYARGPRTSCRWRGISWAMKKPSPDRPNVRCGSMHGPATCANCATRCIARVCWNRARWWMRMLSGLPPPSRHR